MARQAAFAQVSCNRALNRRVRRRRRAARRLRRPRALSHVLARVTPLGRKEGRKERRKDWNNRGNRVGSLERCVVIRMLRHCAAKPGEFDRNMSWVEPRTPQRLTKPNKALSKTSPSSSHSKITASKPAWPSKPRRRQPNCARPTR